MMNTRKMVLLGLFVAQALILSIVESWIPVPVGIPGIKLGLANIITLIVIIFFDFKDTLFVVSIRCLLASIFGGGFIVFLFSVAGGILSSVVMAFLYKKMSKYFSIIGISIAGAVFHNFGQITVASITMRDLSVVTYLPILLISGIIMGCFIGLCTTFLTRALEKTRIFNK